LSVAIINPATEKPLSRDGDWLTDEDGHRFPIVGGVPRVCEADNYTSNFGKQWNMFRETQLDPPGSEPGVSERRFFAETDWDPSALAGLDVLEVGSGAGRFSQVVLQRTRANLYSVDFSSAVEANFENNGAIAPGRFHLFQASVYDMPFPDDSFDKVFCLGVLQHTPDFDASVRSLVQKAKPGGEIVVDFYCIRGFWTKITGKYLLRPWTRRMDQQRLYRLVEKNAGWMMHLAQAMNGAGLHALTRFLPIPDLATMPSGLRPGQLHEWVVLDTFDMLSPEYDNPQRIGTVARMFERSGADVSFAGFIDNGTGKAAVVRATKRAQCVPHSVG
jgi:SAM-dependent methyltransferase